MQVELTLLLPELTFRKIKALNALMGGASVDLDGFVLGLIDKAVSAEIISRVGGVAPAAVPAPRPKRLTVSDPQPEPDELPEDDVSGISSGLGDDAPEEEEEAPNVQAPPPKARVHAVSSEELMADMQVESPLTEAIVSAPEALPGQSAEESFADLSGIPQASPAEPASGTPKRVPQTGSTRGKRRRSLPKTARVSGMFENTPEQSQF